MCTGSTMNLIYYNPRPVNREPNRWAMKILVDLTHADVTLSRGMTPHRTNRTGECINRAKYKSQQLIIYIYSHILEHTVEFQIDMGMNSYFKRQI